MTEESTYELYSRGVELLENGSFAAGDRAASKVAKREPEKTSVREALGRAYFRSRRFAEAAREFEAVVERYPANDFAHFCLGRALELSGERDRARHHLAIAANLRPDRGDYRAYRERLRAALSAVMRRSSSGSASAAVSVDGERGRRIGPGMLVLLGVADGRRRGGGRPDRRQGPRAADLRGRRRGG